MEGLSRMLGFGAAVKEMTQKFTLMYGFRFRLELFYDITWLFSSKFYVYLKNIVMIIIELLTFEILIVDMFILTFCPVIFIYHLCC